MSGIVHFPCFWCIWGLDLGLVGDVGLSDLLTWGCLVLGLDLHLSCPLEGRQPLWPDCPKV